MDDKVLDLVKSYNDDNVYDMITKCYHEGILKLVILSIWWLSPCYYERAYVRHWSPFLCGEILKYVSPSLYDLYQVDVVIVGVKK